MAEDLADLLTEVGLEAPKPAPVIRTDHQVAQKLHALSEAGSERAHDLVDLQLLDSGQDLDLLQLRRTCVRLFKYRRQQVWPPTIKVGEDWGTLYEAASENIDVLPNVEGAVAWVNDFIHRIEAAEAFVSPRMQEAGRPLMLRPSQRRRSPHARRASSNLPQETKSRS